MTDTAPLTPPREEDAPITWHSTRPPTRPIVGALVHSMGETLSIDGALYDAPKALQKIGVSVHAMIRPEGTLIRCVPEQDEAYHAGKSRFVPTGEEWLNKDWLGCEFLVAGVTSWKPFVAKIQRPDAYTAAQYDAGGYLYADWMVRYGIPRAHIVGHETVSGPDVRSDPKPDPGAGFDWDAFWVAVDRWRPWHAARLSPAPRGGA